MTTPHRWFETETLAPRAHPSSTAIRLIHAKAYGTMFTACGVDAGTFTKRWERPFRCFQQDACLECSELVAQASFYPTTR